MKPAVERAAMTDREIVALYVQGLSTKVLTDMVAAADQITKTKALARVQETIYQHIMKKNQSVMM